MDKNVANKASHLLSELNTADWTYKELDTLIKKDASTKDYNVRIEVGGRAVNLEDEQFTKLVIEHAKERIGERMDILEKELHEL